MLKTLKEAKTYAIDRVSQIEGEDLIETEKMLIQTELENLFYEKISTVVSDEEIENLQAENQEDLE
jgi:type III secretory pathway lipoprotein EscJ